MATEDSFSSTIQGGHVHHKSHVNNDNVVSISDVLNNDKFNRYLLFNFLFIGSSFLPSVFIVDYGARWFAGCNPNTADACYGIDYTTLNLWQSISTSMRGVLAFFFAGFVGRLSDAYGRKLFLLLHPILYSLQILPLIIASNFLWYLLLTPCAGLVGASLGLSPMMSAYISDVLPSSQRTLGFAISYGSAGVALLTSAIISLMVSLYLTDYLNFWLILILYVGQTIYIWFFIPESLKDEYMKPLSKKHIMNPLRPLLQIKNNRIVFWISIVQFLITFMEVGILNICMVYILTELHVTESSTNYLLMFTFIISVSFGLFGATAGIIPFSRKYTLDCLWSKKYKPLPKPKFDINNLHPKMSLTEQSQMSEISLMTQQNNQYNNNRDILERQRETFNQYKRIQRQSSMNTDISDIDEDTSLQSGNSGQSLGSGYLIYNNQNGRIIDRSSIPKSPMTPSLHALKDTQNKPYPHRLFGGHLHRMKSKLKKKKNRIHLNQLIDDDEENEELEHDIDIDIDSNAELNTRMASRAWTDYNNLLIGTFLSFLSLLGIGSVAWIHSTVYIAICGVCVGAAVGITFPSANGVATNSLRNDEQGKGFGIIYAVKGITSSVAPFAFGMFYTYLSQSGDGPIIFGIGMILTAIAFIIILFPLRWVLCDQQGNKRKDCLLPQHHDIITYNT